MDYSIVVPIYNEEENIEPFYKRLINAMTRLHKSYEVIFVDDGSVDNSIEILQKIKTNNTKIIKLTRNFGQQAALMAAFSITKGNEVITIDADLQMHPEDIPLLIDKMSEGYDIVYGTYNKNRKNFARKMCSTFAHAILAKLVPYNTTETGGFRMIKSHIVKQIIQFKERSKMLDSLLCWTGYKIGKVDVQHNERLAGKSKYTFFKLLKYWMDMVVSLTYMPLKIAIFGGLFIGSGAILLGLYYFIRYLLFGATVEGFTTLAILIAIFSGVQLFCLGIIGEYLGRTNKEVMSKPEYIIKEII